MDVPFFFSEQLDQYTVSLHLDEAGSRHAIQVLRMKKGEQIQLVNGKGVLAKAIITDVDKRKTGVAVEEIDCKEQSAEKISIAISLIKNTSRFEWFLEKATEIGVSEIIPLLCNRTERQVFRHDRLKQILISAMLQSQQVWMPILHNPISLSDNFKMFNQFRGEKFIAHCEETDKQQLNSRILSSLPEKLMLIGPEGDFTNDEIKLATENNFIPVSLGETRLRTETAGIVAATLMKMG